MLRGRWDSSSLVKLEEEKPEERSPNMKSAMFLGWETWQRHWVLPNLATTLTLSRRHRDHFAVENPSAAINIASIALDVSILFNIIFFLTYLPRWQSAQATKGLRHGACRNDAPVQSLAVV